MSENLLVRFKLISLHKVFGKDCKLFELSFSRMTHGADAVQAFFKQVQVAEVLQAFRAMGRPVDKDKFNFICGGKKLQSLPLQDFIKADTNSVNVLVTLSQ